MQPFRTIAKEGPATLSETARQATLALSEANSVDNSPSTRTAANSKMQSDWVHLVSDEILKIRLSSMPEVQRTLLQARIQKAAASAESSVPNSESKLDAEAPSNTVQEKPGGKTTDAEAPSDIAPEEPRVTTKDEGGLSSSSSFERVEDEGKSATNGRTEQEHHGGAPAAETHAEVPEVTTAEMAPVPASKDS